MVLLNLISFVVFFVSMFVLYVFATRNLLDFIIKKEQKRISIEDSKSATSQWTNIRRGRNYPSEQDIFMEDVRDTMLKNEFIPKENHDFYNAIINIMDDKNYSYNDQDRDTNERINVIVNTLQTNYPNTKNKMIDIIKKLIRGKSLKLSEYYLVRKIFAVNKNSEYMNLEEEVLYLLVSEKILNEIHNDGFVKPGVFIDDGSSFRSVKLPLLNKSTSFINSVKKDIIKRANDGRIK